MRKLLRDNLKRVIAVISLVAMVFAVALYDMYNSAAAFAASTYSDVLDDLQSDEDFNISDYPADSSDYSLYVIQIAESEDNELFIYVYQPYTGSAYDLTATSISMSLFLWNTDDTSYSLYNLSLVSSYGVFKKYVVENFVVGSGDIRYYDISEIYRVYYTAIDGSEINNNTTNELAISVAQCWAASTNSLGDVEYEMQQSDVVTITSSYVGYIRYRSGYTLSFLQDYCDSHFVAFSTDHDIDELLNAKVLFVYQTYKTLTTNVSVSTTYGEEVSEEVYLSCDDVVSYTGIGLFAETFTWERIISASEFVEDYDITFNDDTTEANISSQDWVLCFYETDYTTSSSSAYIEKTGTIVSSVTILQLEFVTGGIVYNLGVVMNKVTGSADPSGTVGFGTSSCTDFNWKTILAIIALVIIVIILFPVLPYIAKFIVWVISLPYKLVKAIYKAVKGSSEKDKDKNKKE